MASPDYGRIGGARLRVTRIVPHHAGVAVRLADDNGPRGGVDKRCVLRVHLAGMRVTVITERAVDVYAALEAAAGGR